MYLPFSRCFFTLEFNFQVVSQFDRFIVDDDDLYLYNNNKKYHIPTYTNPITASIIKNMMIGILSCKYIHKYKNNCIIIVLSFLFINYTAILQDQWGPTERLNPSSNHNNI